MKPLIKYTGGKFKEYKKLRDFLPNKIENYYEPFFGGGGFFFGMVNDKLINGDVSINDFSQSLIEFYQSLTEDGFDAEMYKISNAWEFIKELGEEIFNRWGDRFMELIVSKEKINFVDEMISHLIRNKIETLEFNSHGFSISDKINHSLNDKLKRFQKKSDLDDMEEIPYKCITTAVCQAFYFIIRDMYNDWNNHGHYNDYTQSERSAEWLFIREFCFGSMFRFGANGDFNIPYGGYGYNTKCFTCKIENILDDEVQKVFSKLNIKCGDFEDAINNWKPSENDFMFLDPPYDSTFSEYDNNEFGRKDHIRLKECLDKCKCKWMIAIGKTDFIADLYKDYNVLEYDKTYMYQARGEYDNKHTTHLLVTNYPVKNDDDKQLEIPFEENNTDEEE